jgi:membrane protease subunit HflK
MSFKIPDTPEELFRQGRRGFDHLTRWIPFLVFVVVLLLIILTSFYQIEPNEVGVIRRFGRYQRTEPSGLHWKFPFNIEQLTRVPLTTVFTEEFGFRTIEPGIKTQYSSKKYEEESLMLTGDLNVIDVAWAVLYKVKDPIQLAFNLREPQETVRDISEVVMRQVIGDRSVDDVLTVGSEEITEDVKTKMQDILDSYTSGIDIIKVEIQSVNPPDEVKPSFTKVDSAKKEKERLINEAHGEYNRLIYKASGEANQMVREAEGYATRRINEAKGDAAQFLATWEAYKSSKEVTRKRLYLETLQEILPKVGKVYLMDPEGNNPLPILNLKDHAP